MLLLRFSHAAKMLLFTLIDYAIMLSFFESAERFSLDIFHVTLTLSAIYMHTGYSREMLLLCYAITPLKHAAMRCHYYCHYAMPHTILYDTYT